MGGVKAYRWTDETNCGGESSPPFAIIEENTMIVIIRILVTLIGLSLTTMSATAAEGVRVWQNSAGAGFPQFHAAMVANGHANDQAISTNALGLQAFVFAQSNGYLERVPEANRNPTSYAALFRRWNGLSSEVISVEQFRAKGSGNGFWLPVLDSPAAAPVTELVGDIEAITASIRAMAERLAALEAEDLNISDVFGLERRLGELSDSIPNLGPLQGSVAELARFMQALKAGDMSEIEALQGNLVAAVERAFNTRLTALEESFNERIVAEAGVRSEADEALGREIDAEAEARQRLADALAELTRLSATNAELEGEISARQAGDTALGESITALTAEGGAITLLRAALADVTGEGGELAKIWAELNALAEDGGRLTVIEGQLVALDSQGRQIADLDRSIDVLADWIEANQTAFEALIAEGGRLSAVEGDTATNAGDIARLEAMIEALALSLRSVAEQSATSERDLEALTDRVAAEEAARAEGDQTLQTYGIWAAIALVVLFGLGLAVSGYRRGDRIGLARRVKKLEDIGLADLEWHPENADLTTLEPGLENVAVWRVRQAGTEDWCAVKIGREADTPEGQVFTDLPAEVGGEPSDQLFSIEELPRLDILLALKEKRLVPSTLEEAAA